ncbi:sensor histidine kinase [Pseudidiomarina donghaiensis]|uniref:histidine kinase n=1 Tax=Pseudidiomarina donghaiensis TaxID=519452 RepID=A0A432XI59_9GAMM|nr:HAMP domain-containing sensor histidine kinase [Pseudidiomarina donghaiensis]RUO48418.1 sensor histidine kinase [Pseudidiomarina donghaiensis]SFV24167.1 His Kinase A (phospho-acceptor) domain-containing protein [Pseudidiomarina donghaiensis]
MRWYHSLTLRLLLLFWALLFAVASSGFLLAIWYSQPETPEPLSAEISNSLSPILSDPSIFSSLTPGRILAGNYRVAAAVTPEEGPTRLQLEPNLANTHRRELLSLLDTQQPQQLRLPNGMLLGPFGFEAQRILLIRPLTEEEREQQQISAKQAEDAQTLVLLFGSLLIAVLLGFWLVRPLKKLIGATREIAAGADKLHLKRLPKRNDELGELARALETAAHDLKVSRDAQRRLLSDVSHELRSPLARMQVALMLSQDDDADANPHLVQMSRDVDRLGTIIERILSLSRLENGLVKLHPEPVNTYELAQTLAADLTYVDEQQGKRVLVLKGEWPVTATDDELLRLVIENLVRNALQYTDGIIELSCVRHDNDNCTILVRDHGDGVPEAQLEQLFEPFYRGDPSRNHKAGVGLGMALSLRAANVLGGSVTARNHPDGGLEVSINLPIQHLQETEQEQQEPA